MKKKIRYILFIIFLFCMIIMPITLSKYTKKFNRTITVNVRNPEYTIQFNANGGTGTMANQAMVYGTAQNLTLNSYTRTNYNFLGWNTKADGSGTSYSDGQSVNNLSSTEQDTVILYAKWQQIFTVTFNSDGGTAVASQNVADGSTATRPTDPTKTDYIFDGWQLNGADYNFATPVTGDITLTAKWKRALSNPLISGEDLILKLKNLSGDNYSNWKSAYSNANTTIRKIVRAADSDYEAKRNSLTSNNIISVSGSSTDVYAWFENDTIYIYSDAEKFKLTGSMDRAFARMSNLTDISALEYFDTSNVTDINRMFQECTNLTDLSPIANWDVSNVTDMTFTFGASNTSTAMSITDLSPLANWNVSSVTTFFQTFKYCSQLKTLAGLENWDVSSATRFEQMFNWCGLTDATAIENWNVDRTDNFIKMLDNNSSLPSDKKPIFTNLPGTWNNAGTYIPS